MFSFWYKLVSFVYLNRGSLYKISNDIFISLKRGSRKQFGREKNCVMKCISHEFHFWTRLHLEDIKVYITPSFLNQKAPQDGSFLYICTSTGFKNILPKIKVTSSIFTLERSISCACQGCASRPGTSQALDPRQQF